MQHIEMEELGEEASTEISSPHMWLNVPSQSEYYGWRAEPKEG